MNKKSTDSNALTMLIVIILAAAVGLILFFALRDNSDGPKMPDCESDIYNGVCTLKEESCPDGMREQVIEIKDICPEGKKCCVP